MSPDRLKDLRERMLAELRAGRTLVLSTAEQKDPDVVRAWARLLDELGHEAGAGTAGLPQVPGYRLLAEIGQGGMSTVYLAVQENLGRKVAIKVLPPWLDGQEKARERLVREARSLARVRHPNVVEIHDVLDQDGTLAIALQWVDGVSLQQLIDRLPQAHGSKDMLLVHEILGCPNDNLAIAKADYLPFVVERVRDVGLAVQAVHDEGLLHLDIKPSNILLQRDGRPLLADFGVARDIDLLLTHTASFAGTPIYAAPEQLRRDDALIGPPADVYGLGMTLYEAITRRKPIAITSMSQMIQDIERGAVPPLRGVNGVPAALADVVHCAIDPDPRRRYATPRAFADDLQRFLAGQAVLARPAGRWQRLLAWRRREPRRASLALAVVLLGAFGVVVGGVLLAELPRIQAARRVEGEQLSREDAQRAFQVFFRNRDLTAGPRRSVAAVVANPHASPATLAAVITLTSIFDTDSSYGMLSERRGELGPHLAYAKLQAKVTDRRQYFQAGEVDELERSGTPLDLMVAAIDQIVLAAERDEISRLPRCLPWLERAHMASPVADPMIVGLLLYVAERSGADAGKWSWALDTHWPDHERALSWRLIAEPMEPPLLERARTWLQAHPESDAVRLDLIARLQQSGMLEDMRRELTAATEAGVTSETLMMFKLVDDLRQGVVNRIPELKLTTTGHDLAEDTMALAGAVELVDRAEAVSMMARAVATCHGAVRAQMLHYWGTRLMQENATEGLNRMREAATLRPDRASIAWDLSMSLASRGEVTEALPIVRNLIAWGATPPAKDAWFWVANTLLRKGEYALLVPWCERWGGFDADEYRRKLYSCYALSRLGRYEEAMGFASDVMKRRPSPMEAFVERSWFMVAPDGPASLRNPEKAMRDMRVVIEQYEVRKRAIGPWVRLVWAETLFASGEAAKAIEQAQLGQSSLAGNGAEHAAPLDIAQRLEAALARYRKQ